MKVCFDINHSEYLALKTVAQRARRSPREYVKAVVVKALEADARHSERKGRERRAHSRQEVSIPAVSCVNFPDRVVRSLPVTINDISKGGVCITFHNLDMGFAEKLSNVSRFEVVFTIPETFQTVSFSCHKRWYNIYNGVKMGGGFDVEDSSVVESLGMYMEG